MNLGPCLKKLGLSKHERAIMRALVRDHQVKGLPEIEAAKRAVQQRLKELQDEKSSVHKQINEQHAAKSRLSATEDSAGIGAHSDATIAKSSRNSVLADTELFGNRSDAKAIAVKGFDSLDRERQHVVLAHVITALDDEKIFNAVVKAVPVDVMDLLIGKKVSPEMLLHDKTMLTHRLSVPRDVPILKPVSRFVDSVSAFIGKIPASNGTKESGLRGKSGIVESAADRLAAKTAGTIDDRHGVTPDSGATLRDGTAETAPHPASHIVSNAVDIATHEAATSPLNSRPLPTQAQIDAGNYKLGHLNLFGLNISIENPKGSVRSGTEDGKPWQVKMQNAYGYIKGTKGRDKEHLDVYLGEHLTEDAPVFVVDQIDPKTGKYDEAKIVLGARGYGEAKDIYDNHFADDSGETRRGAISKMSLERFKEWLKSGDTKNPVKYKEPKEAPPNEIVPPEPATPASIPTTEDSAVPPESSGAQAAAVPATPALAEKVETPASRGAKPAERYAGMYGKGLSEFVAKQQQKRLATERPELDWKVEEAPQYGDQRFDVAGYKKALEPSFSKETSNANIPDGWEVNEENRKEAQILETYFKQQGRDVAVTPLAPRADGRVGHDASDGVLRDGRVPDDQRGQVDMGRVRQGAGREPSQESGRENNNAAKVGPDIGLAQKLAGLFGKKVVFITTDGPLNFGGVTFPKSHPNDIWIDVRSKRAAHMLVGHELTHHMEEEAPAVYAQLRSAVEGLLKNHEEYYRRNDLQQGEYASKEMIGDLMGDNFDKPEFWKRVAEESKGAFRQIARSVVKWLDDLLGKITKRGFRSDQFVSDVEGARNALAKALADYGGINRGASIADEVTLKPKFSRERPDWVEKMSPEAQEALRKAGVWTPKQTLKERFTDLKSEAGQKILQGTLDQFAPVLKKIGDYPYKLLRMASSADAGLEASLEYGRLKLNSVGALETMKGTKGFLEVMKPLQGEADRFLSWVAGNRAEQLSKEDREHLFGQTDIQELKKLNTKTHAADNFADGTDGSKRSEVYQKVLKDYNEFSKSILDIAQQSGIIDGEKRALWEKEFYVPFFREAEEKVTGPGNLSGMVNQYAFKKLKGGEQPLHDLLANTMQNWSHLLNASLKNNAARETLEQGAKLGIAHEVNPHETSAADKPVYILKNGEKVHYVVTDPLVLDAVSSLGASPFKGPIMDALGKMKNILTVGTTSSPVFRLRHTIREQITALAANPTTYNFVKNWIDGFKYSSRNNPEYGNMLAGGGFFRMGMSLQDQNGAYVKRLLAHGVDAATVLDTPDKVKEALKGAWDWWKETGERSDSITRANIYRQVYASLVDKVGSDKAHFEAAYAARDVMDYGLRGTWPALRMITQAVPFMNARMQGLYKLGRGAVADPKRFSAVVGGITLATIALSLAYRNDKDFQEREEWDRDNNWWAKIGDKAVRMPKPFELGGIASIAERALDMALSGFDPDSRERFASRMLGIVGSQLNLNPVPQAIWPIIQTWANKDVFTGRTIESQRDQNLTTENRISPNTSGTARLLGKAGVLSPEQIDFLVNAYFGWVGSHVVATADLALRPAMGLPDKPTPKVDDYFIVGDFVKDMPSNQSRFVEQFYDHLKTTQQAFGDMRMYQQTGQAEAAKQAAQTANVQLAGMYRQAMTTIGHINQQVRLIQSEEIDPDEKRQKLDKLYQMRNAIARSVETTRNARL